MATLDAQAPDGATISIDVPEGTPESMYPHMVEDAVNHYVSTKTTGLEAFGRAAVNNLPAGGQLGAVGTSIAKDIPYSDAMAEWNKQIAGAKAQHPIAYGTGAVAGAAAPLAIPGVGEALAASPAASGAALGALNAVGNTDITKQPGTALKQAAIGAGTGAVLGKALPSGTQAGEDLESIANQKAVQSLGLKPGVLGIPKEELEDLGQFAHQTGLTQGSLEARVNTAKDLLQQTGAQVGEMGVGAAPLADASPYIQQLHDKLQESASIFGPEANAETGVYRQALANLSKPGMTFDQLQQLKTAVGQRAFDSIGQVKNDAAADVYGIYKDAMKSIVDSSPTDYQEAMTAYGKLKDIHSALMNQFQKEQASGIQAKGFGMVGKLAGMVGGNNPAVNAGAAAMLAPAHPFMALGALTPIMTNPSAMESLARGASEVVPAVAGAAKLGSIDSVTSYLTQTLSSNPQKLGKFAQPLIQAAKTGGTQGLAAQHFILAQQYPEYNSLMMDRKEPTNENQ